MNRIKNLGHRIKAGIGRAAKAVSGMVAASGNQIATGIRFALSMGNPGRWASDHREESHHFTGWNYVCIHALGLQAMQCDVAIYSDGPDPEAVNQKRAMRKSLRRRGKAYTNTARLGKQLPPDDRLVKLMKHPNPSQSGGIFRYEQIMQLQITGTCIVWNVPNRLGLPVERYVIPTCLCYPVPPSKEFPRGAWRIDGSMNRFAFMLDADGFSELQGMFLAIGYVIPAEQTQVIRWPHPIWKDDGYGPLAAGAVWSDTAEQMDQTRWASLKQGPNPSVFITMPPDWDGSTEQLGEMKSTLQHEYGGPDNAGKPFFVTGGATVSKAGLTAKEMDFVGSFPQARECMLALHGTPPVAVGIATDGSHAAFYVGMKQYTTLKVQPALDMLAEDDTEHLLPYFGEGLTSEWSCATIDDPDQDDRNIKNGIAGGAITKGELRVMINLEPWGDSRDDEIAEPKTPPPAGAPGAAAKPSQPQPKPQPKPADKEEMDERTTGIPTGIPTGGGKHFNRLMGDPVMKAAVEGALSGVGSHREAVELCETWKWNGDQAV